MLTQESEAHVRLKENRVREESGCSWEVGNSPGGIPPGHEVILRPVAEASLGQVKVVYEYR